MAGGCHNHNACINNALAEAEETCAAKGLRFTQIRRDVFKLIWGSHKAVTAAQIMEKLGNKQPPITYRALEFLTAANLIHHVVSLNAYIGCNHTHSSHSGGQLLICTDCHDVIELDVELSRFSGGADKLGFNIQQAHIEMLGQCRNCA